MSNGQGKRWRKGAGWAVVLMLSASGWFALCRPEQPRGIGRAMPGGATTAPRGNGAPAPVHRSATTEDAGYGGAQAMESAAGDEVSSPANEVDEAIAWVQTDARAAARWVEQMPAGGAKGEAFLGVAMAWAHGEPEEAERWVRAWPVEEEREQGLLGVAYETARVNPREAIRLAMDQAVSPEWDDLIRYTAMQWAASDPEGAATLAVEIGDESLRERMLSSVATVLGETAPTAAARLALESMLPGRLQDDALIGIVQRWVQKEPETVAEWVAQFPDGPLRCTAMESVVKLWADRDLQEVRGWITGLPNGAVRDTARSVLDGWLSPAEPVLPAERVGFTPFPGTILR